MWRVCLFPGTPSTVRTQPGRGNRALGGQRRRASPSHSPHRTHTQRTQDAGVGTGAHAPVRGGFPPSQRSMRHARALGKRAARAQRTGMARPAIAHAASRTPRFYRALACSDETWRTRALHASARTLLSRQDDKPRVSRHKNSTHSPLCVCGARPRTYRGQTRLGHTTPPGRSAWTSAARSLVTSGRPYRAVAVASRMNSGCSGATTFS